MLFIIIALAISALYSGSMWLAVALWAWPRREMLKRPENDARRQEVQQHTFNLGLCFVLSLGFLGMIIA